MELQFHPDPAADSDTVRTSNLDFMTEQLTQHVISPKSHARCPLLK
jgi:hypothetical protein